MSLIQWTKGAKYWDKTWNPVVGCKPCSEGCDNCYAEALCKRFDMNGNGKFEPTQKKSLPPRSGVVFVGNMTDIFGEWNSDQDIIEWTFDTEPRAANLFLTKRADRLARLANLVGPVFSDYCATYYGITAENDYRFRERFWPLARHYDLSLWLSAEPLLGPIKLDFFGNFYHPDNDDGTSLIPAVKMFRWVVVGAESGPNRRPCRTEWVEDIVETCQANNVPVFVKQLDIGGRLVKDIEQFPKHLRIRQVPWVKKEVTE